MVQGENSYSGVLAVQPPRAILSATVDSSGRLKLPKEFHIYLAAIGADKVFITTLDMQQVRVYPLEVWKQNEALFRNAGPNAAAAQRMSFLAKLYGDVAALDGSGRVLIPASLRELLKLEQQQVWLEEYNGRINVMNAQAREMRVKAVQEHMATDLDALDQMGLK